MTYVLEREQLIPRPRHEVFAFFAEASNLERLTPKMLRFEIRTPGPIAMHAGTLIDYRLSLFGVGFGWRTLIEVWEPDARFVDRQVKGPYRSWHHLHEFTEVPGGTRMNDRVTYEVPGGPLAPLAHRLFVRPQVEAIFAFRYRTIESFFPAAPAA